MKIVKNLLFFWMPVFLWAFVIYSFSSFPTVKASEIHWQDFITKKLAHVIEYFIFSVLLFRAFKNSGFSAVKSAFLAILIGFFYGASDEFHQSFTPGREPKARDVIFDTIGAIAGVYFSWKLLQKAPRRLRALGKRLDLI